MAYSASAGSGEKRFLSTGEAAELLGVKPDTVLKWVRKGRIPSWTTAGGHHRIEVSEVERIRESRARRPGRPYCGNAVRCWEFFACGGAVRDACTRCIVYRSRAERCYELAAIGGELGHEHVYCKDSCEACAFYRHAKGLPQRVLIVTADEELTNRLRREQRDSIVIRFAADAYTASTAVGSFLPGMVVVDRGLPQGEWQALVRALETDGRVPWVRVVIAGDSADPSVESIPKTFSVEDLVARLDLSGV